MAAAIKVFLLFLAVVIVKSHHLHRIHHRLHDRLGIHNLLNKIFHPGVTGFFGTGSLGNEDGHGPVGDIGIEDNHVSLDTGIHNENYGQGTVVPNQNNYNIEKPNQPTSDVNLNTGAPNLNGRANVNNGQSDEPQHGPNVDHQADTTQSQLNIASDIVVGQNINADVGLNTAAGNDAAQGLISQNNPKENGDLMGNEKKAPEPKLIPVRPIDLKLVPGFHNDEINNGVLIIEPEFKINDTGAEINKYSYIVVFPDDVNRAKEQNQNNLQQSLPNRINTGDNNNQYPSVVAPGLDSTAAPPTNNIQWITPNNVAQTIPLVNNQSTQNQPSNVIFVQNPNQQVPDNNGSPYVHVIRDASGGYAILNTPNNNSNVGQINVPGNGNSGVKNPGQSYVITDTGNSGVNSKPGQIYLSGNSGTYNPGQTYVIADTDNSGVNSKPGQIYVSGNSGTKNPGQTYVIAGSGNSGVNSKPDLYLSGNSGTNNPGLTYVIADTGNSGVNSQPGQIYLSGNSGTNNPGQTYVIADTGNSGVNSQPGQIYVSGNSGTNNPGQTYVIAGSSNSGVNSKPGQIYLSGNSGTNNPGQIYVIADSGNSGFNSKPGQIYLSGNSRTSNPGQTYVIAGSGNSGVNSKPGQIYVSGNSETNNPGLIYVPGNSGASNPSQMYVPKNVPSSGSQTTGGYYNIVHLNNGQTVLVPVNNVQNAQWNGRPNNGPIYVPVNNNPSQGYQVLGNNPTGSVVNLGSAGGNGGSTNNVPLLISYKDKDGDDEEISDQLKDEKSK